MSATLTSRQLHRWTVEQLTQEREALQWQLGETEAIKEGLLPNQDDWCGVECLESGMLFTAEWILEIDAELDKRRAMLRGGYGPKVGKPQRTDIFRTVRDRVSILDFCERHGPHLRGRGDSYMAHCPFPDHDDSDPSFHVTPSKGLWTCFGCGRAGDVLHLGMMVYGVGSVVEAARMMAQEWGIELEPATVPANVATIKDAYGNVHQIAVQAPKRRYGAFSR